MKKILSQQFATRFAIRPQQFSWLLGAGASASAGIPTGYMMIRDFKTEIFCNENTLPRREIDASDPIWIERIDAFFSKRSILPPAGDPSEYSKAFEVLYPTEAERRVYIDQAIRQGTPSFGHRILAALITTKRINCIFTTNFDNLLEISTSQTDLLLDAPHRALPTVSAIDSAERAERCFKESAWPLITKLHGDYQSTQLKNTAEELIKQDERLRKVLKASFERFGLIVSGYSGRDASIIEVINEALLSDNPFPAGIYWVAKSEESLLPVVKDVLTKAEEKGVDVSIVISQNFDELFADIISKFELPAPLEKHIFETKPLSRSAPIQFIQQEASKFPVLRCSGLLLSKIPESARFIRLNKHATTGELRQLIKQSKVFAVVASIENGLAAFGPDDGLIKALAPLDPTLDGIIRLNPFEDSWAVGLIYDALIQGLCRGRPLAPLLRARGHSLVISNIKPNTSEIVLKDREQKLKGLLSAYKGNLIGTIPKHNYEYSEGLYIKLEHCINSWWCVFEPFTSVKTPKDLIEDPTKDWRRERWVRKYNGEWSEIISEWANLLGDTADGVLKTYGIPSSIGIDACFGISSITAWSRPAHHHEYFKRQS